MLWERDFFFFSLYNAYSDKVGKMGTFFPRLHKKKNNNLLNYCVDKTRLYLGN